MKRTERSGCSDCSVSRMELNDVLKYLIIAFTQQDFVLTVLQLLVVNNYGSMSIKLFIIITL